MSQSPSAELKQLEAEFDTASRDMKRAADKVTNFASEGKGDDQERFTRLTEDFDEAERLATVAKDRLTLARNTQVARESAMPPSSVDSVRVNGEPATYQRNGQHSFFRDLVRQDKDVTAQERLQRHQREAADHFDLSSTDSAGGYLVAPLYLQDEFVDYARAGRAVTNAIGPRALPPNTDSINIPKLSTGTAVADQADNAAVQETDATFGTLAADVKTIAGMQDISRQVIDRSVPGVDEVIYADLVKAYNVNLDTAVINSSVSNNKGLLQVSSTNSVTYTDANPTLPELYPKLADGIQQIHSSVYTPATAIFMHPRRWGWILASLDTQNRPLVLPIAAATENSAGTQTTGTAEGQVGSIQGIPVYADANIPTTLGASTNEDRIIIAATPELFVWEDPNGPYLERFDDVGSGTLTVRLRAHSYWGQLLSRRPAAISVLSGTGLAAPLFA
jgi:HK97 family phage major capsid protein